MRTFDFAGPGFFHFPIPIPSSNHRASCLALSHLLTFFPMWFPFPFLVRIRCFDTLTLFLAIGLPICRPPPLHFYFLFCVSSTFTHLARSLTFNGVCCVEIGIIQSAAKPDTEYALFGGGVRGKYLSLTPGKEIKQTWALQSPTWPDGAFYPHFLMTSRDRRHSNRCLPFAAFSIPGIIRPLLYPPSFIHILHSSMPSLLRIRARTKSLSLVSPSPRMNRSRSDDDDQLRSVDGFDESHVLARWGSDRDGR